jgi:hypothetical protein
MIMQTPHPRADLEYINIGTLNDLVLCCKHLPDHHGTTTDFLDVPDWRIRCDGESGVENTSEDTGKQWGEVEVGEDLCREIYQHVDTKELLRLVVR